MSLVQVYLNKNFIVIGGEQRLTREDGYFNEGLIKVRRITADAVIGMTGTVVGNALLFAEIVNLKLESGDLDTKKNFADVEKIVDSNFYELRKLVIENNEQYNIHSVLCGWDGKKLKCKYYCFDINNPDGKIIEVFAESENDIKVVNCGKEEHFDKALELGQAKRCQTPEDFQKLFCDVIREGHQFDSTINDKVTLETMKKSDFV